MDSITKPIEHNIVAPILGDEFEVGQAKAQGKCPSHICNTKALYKPSKTIRNAIRMGALGAGVGASVSGLSNNGDILKGALIGGGIGVANALVFPGIAFHVGHNYEKIKKKIEDVIKSK